MKCVAPLFRDKSLAKVWNSGGGSRPQRPPLSLPEKNLKKDIQGFLKQSPVPKKNIIIPELFNDKEGNIIPTLNILAIGVFYGKPCT